MQARLEPRASIGTLTGWQLLADQVTKDAAAREAADSTIGSAASGCDTPCAGANGAPRSGSAGRLHQLRTQNSLGASSSMSEDSTPSISNSVTPRPHQWLYKEYKLLEEIGSGGFGRVCKARRLADSKMVVVKEIKTTALSPKQKAATMDEVEVLAKFDHPNIVHYHDCFMDEVYINIVMEYCDSGDLTGVIKGRKGALMPEDMVMDYFVQVCLALQYVHAQGILHRDLKPSNVLVTSSGLLKMGDFGVSKISNTDASMANTIVGTPHYLSPEMCDNKPYGRRSDVWALGCMLVELCTLSKAFDSSSISKIILSIMSGQYKPLPQQYSPQMRQLVATLLQVAPAARPSVQEILQMPFVRQHLQRYFAWAINVPEARLEAVASSLQGIVERPRAAAGAAKERMAASAAAAAAEAKQQQQRQQQQQQPPAFLEARSGGGSGAGASPCAERLASALSTASSAVTSPRCGAALAQEQLEGMRRLRGLKNRLQLSSDGSGGLGSPAFVYGLSHAMSLDSEQTGQ